MAPDTARGELSHCWPQFLPGGKAVLYILDLENDIWIWDFAHETLTRLTDSSALNADAVWTPDGRRLAFVSTRFGTANLFSQAADRRPRTQRVWSSCRTGPKRSRPGCRPRNGSERPCPGGAGGF